MSLYVIYTHIGIQQAEQHQVMQHILDATLPLSIVDKVILTEFGPELLDINIQSPKFKRFFVPYPFGEWRAGLMRNVAVSLLDLNLDDVLVFGDTDVLFTHDALEWAVANVGDNHLLQFPRMDLGPEPTERVLAGRMSIEDALAGVRVHCGPARPPDATWFDEGCINKGEQALLAKDFLLIGGYDCHIHGWGYYDVDFYNMAKQVFGFQIVCYPGQGTFHFWHPVHSAVDSVQNRQNAEYSIMKIKKLLEASPK